MRFCALRWSTCLASALLCPAIALAESGGQNESAFLSIFLSWVPILVLIAIWVYFMRSAQPAQKRGEQYVARKEKHMERVEQLLGEISTQLGRIATSSETRRAP